MKRLLFALLHIARVTRVAAWWNRKRVVFLCYHGVTERPNRGSPDPKGLHVNHQRFAAHLDYLKRHCQIISLREYLECRSNGRRLPHYCAVLTFDDGFRNFFTTAAPILRARGISATVFLITDKTRELPNHGLRRNWSPEDDSTYLSWQEARTLMADQQIEFGSHTCSHSSLLTLSAEETERELRHSYNDLVTHLAVKTPALSYPKGQYSRMLAEDARKIGYACAVTTNGGLNETDHNPFTLGRTLIGDFDDEASFAVRLSGLRSWLIKVGHLFAWPRYRPEPEAGFIKEGPHIHDRRSNGSRPSLGSQRFGPS